MNKLHISIYRIEERRHELFNASCAPYTGLLAILRTVDGVDGKDVPKKSRLVGAGTSQEAKAERVNFGWSWNHKVLQGCATRIF